MFYCAIIKYFANRDTEKFYITGKSRKVPSTIHKVALRKLDYLNAQHMCLKIYVFLREICLNHSKAICKANTLFASINNIASFSV